MTVALATITHDPHEKLLRLIIKHREKFQLFLGGAVTGTNETSAYVIQALEWAGLKSVIQPRSPLGIARRMAVDRALSNRPNHVFYCDLDRLLWWMDTRPDELESVIQQDIPQREFLIIGRTQAAMNTHPAQQIWAEQKVNLYFDGRLGHPAGYTLDLLTAARSMTADIAVRVLGATNDPEVSVDVEWPLIYHSLRGRLFGIFVDGLSYEGSLAQGELEVASMQQWLAGDPEAREGRYREWCVGRMMYVIDQFQENEIATTRQPNSGKYRGVVAVPGNLEHYGLTRFYRGQAIDRQGP